MKAAMKVGNLRMQNGAPNRQTKVLLTLYRRKGLAIARAGAPSPFAASSEGENGS